MPKLGKSLSSTVKNIREGMGATIRPRPDGAEEVVVRQSEEDKEIVGSRGQARCCQKQAGGTQRRGRR